MQARKQELSKDPTVLLTVELAVAVWLQRGALVATFPTSARMPASKRPGRPTRDQGSVQVCEGDQPTWLHVGPIDPAKFTFNLTPARPLTKKHFKVKVQLTPWALQGEMLVNNEEGSLSGALRRISAPHVSRYISTFHNL